MRVILISQYFHPEQFSNNAIAKNLVARGHDVHAVPCVPNYPSGTFFEGFSNRSRRLEMWEGVKITRAATIARGKSALTLIANYLFYPLSASWTIYRQVKERPDVSFVSMPSPLLQALVGIILRWRQGVPCVYWVQDIWPESATYTLGLKNPLIVRALGALCGWIYRRADIVLVQSAAFPPMIERHGVRPERIGVLPNTAPPTYRPLTPGEAPAQAVLVPQDGFRLMFAGNVGESQDFDTLVATADILREHEHLKWVVVGTGRDEARVRALIVAKKLDDRFHFVGRHPEEAMPSFFAHADAMLVSLKDIPIFSLTVPYKVQCYMACGKPIVAALNGEGARIVNESGAGTAVAAGDPEALAQAVLAMMQKTPDERDALASSSRAYFERHYSPEKVYGDLERFLRDACELKRSK